MAPPRTPLGVGELTALPQTPYLHWEENRKGWEGREDRKGEERVRKGRGEEGKGVEEKGGEGRRERNGPPLLGQVYALDADCNI